MSGRGGFRGRGGRGGGGSSRRSTSSSGDGPSSSGGFSRGGGRGGGGFRGGRGRGGGEMKERSAGRDATSLQQLFNKNTRYDHRIAKEHKFWDKSKKLRSYHRMLKKEGLEQPGERRKHADGESAPENGASSSSSYVPPTAVRVANPDDIFAAQPDLLPKAPQPKQKKRKREDNGEGGNGEKGMFEPSSLPPDHPEFKKRKLTPAELAALRAEKKQKWEQKQKDFVVAQERRAHVHEKMTEKNARGQPVLKNQMELLLEKLQKQAGATKK